MDNLISIFSRKTPCDNLLISKQEFDSFYSSCIEDENHESNSHIYICPDCSQRYFVENRETVENRIKSFLKSLAENLENPNA